MGKKTFIAIGLLCLIGGGAYIFRIELMLAGIRFAAERQYEVTENRPVDWAVGPEQRSGNQPNIVLIMADDLGWNDISLNGGGIANGVVQTPHIDSIAQQGVNFVNAYAGQGTCAPSRAMIMTGRYGSRFGFEYTPTPNNMLKALTRLRTEKVPPAVEHFDEAKVIPFENMGVPASEITIAEMLKQQGYYTAHIGKWHLGRSNGSAPHDQGFDQSLLMVSGKYGEDDDPDVVSARLEFDPIDRFLWAAMRFAASLNGGEAFKPDEYLTDYYTTQAVKVIENNRHRPFFLYLAHWAPHTPLQAKKEDYDALPMIDDHITRTYGAMVRGLDRGVGQVLQALKDNGIDDNTIVIFSSDNGGAGYVGIDDLNKPYRGWKITNFEGGIHVPFLMRWPGKLDAGQTFSGTAHHFDIFATAAGVAGANLPDDRKLDGVNLLPFLSGEKNGNPHETLFWRAGKYRTVRHGDWKLAVDPTQGQTQGKSWLFNLKDDPTEQHNIVADNRDIEKELMALLAGHEAEMVPPLWGMQVERPTYLDKHLREERDPGKDEYVYWGN